MAHRVGRFDARESLQFVRITVWGINYLPELTGIAPFNTELCNFLKSQGHDARMVTTFSYYPAWCKLPSERFRLFRTDNIEDVTVYRCWHYVPQKVTAFKRILHEGTFVLTSFCRQIFLSRPDVFVVISPPLFLGFAAWLIGKIKRAPFVFHVQDLQPDAASTLGMIKSRALIRVLYGLEKLAYTKAARVSGISRGMLSAFEKKGVSEDRRIYFPNGVELPDSSHIPPPGAFRKSHGFSSTDFLAVYSGNLGVKQGLEVLIEAARLMTEPRIRIVICGEGNQRERLMNLAKAHQLQNVIFIPLQPELRYHEMLVDADICVIPQQRGVGNFFFPSKLLTALAFSRPVISIADEESELVEAVNAGGFGVNVEPSNPARLAELISRLALEPERLQKMGGAGQRFAGQFEMKTVQKQFETALVALAPRSRHGRMSISRLGRKEHL
jgi:colanic acid biosynthesis glycosyl transferase WcaI